ncbi:MAG: triose-phosphate isomerase [Alphaproteobacteria bacterium]|nr:triose-phosphate isomerase [Alphaproteobacteria bacterium]
MKFLIANWKMNGDLHFAEQYVQEMNDISSEHEIIICPPFPLLLKFKDCVHSLGAQNCCFASDGAFTGEVSPNLLKELGCTYVIIGHSERRTIFHETDADIEQKFKILSELKLNPIVCIGEKENERDNWKGILSKQISWMQNANLENAIIAYEPLWSIGTNIIPTTNEISEVAKFLKSQIDAPVTYGGSVNASNACTIFNIPNIDGLLIGRASWTSKSFAEIIREVEE